MTKDSTNLFHKLFTIELQDSEVQENPVEIIL